jgi:hypothetical protein
MAKYEVVWNEDDEEQRAIVTTDKTGFEYAVWEARKTQHEDSELLSVTRLD